MSLDRRTFLTAGCGVGLARRWENDVIGILTLEPGGKLPRIGDRIEFIVPHCDPTTNLYDRIYAVRGERVEAIWPIVARRELAS